MQPRHRQPRPQTRVAHQSTRAVARGQGMAWQPVMRGDQNSIGLRLLASTALAGALMPTGGRRQGRRHRGGPSGRGADHERGRRRGWAGLDGEAGCGSQGAAVAEGAGGKDTDAAVTTTPATWASEAAPARGWIRTRLVAHTGHERGGCMRSLPGAAAAILAVGLLRGRHREERRRVRGDDERAQRRATARGGVGERHTRRGVTVGGGGGAVGACTSSYS